jgi:hypothetical protein
MNDHRTNSGKWIVIAILALGVVAALVGLKFRYMPFGNPPAPATTRAADAR